MIESIDEKDQILGAENPQVSVRNKSQNLDIISEIGIKNNLKTVNVYLAGTNRQQITDNS